MQAHESSTSSRDPWVGLGRRQIASRTAIERAHGDPTIVDGREHFVDQPDEGGRAGCQNDRGDGCYTGGAAADKLDGGDPPNPETDEAVDYNQNEDISRSRANGCSKKECPSAEGGTGGTLVIH